MRERDVHRILREVEPSVTRRVVVFVTPGTGASAVVAGRRVGGAVQRNRARRIMREALRRLRDEQLIEGDVVVVARAAIRGARTQDLVGELSELLGEGTDA